MIDRRLVIGGGLAGLTLAGCGPAPLPYRDPLADTGESKLSADELPSAVPGKGWGRGLPPKGRFGGLLYNEPSQCLVAAFQQRIDAVQWSQDLYYRHRSSAEYRRIPGSDNQLHYRDVVSSANVPKIFFNVTRWNELGGDWASISSFNLTTAELRTELTGANLRDERVWVSSLVSVRDDASSLFCTVGFEEPLGSGGSIVHYWLCDIRLADFSLTKVSSLPETFA